LLTGFAIIEGDLMDRVLLKQQAAYQAVTLVESGMVVGLGHGSTVVWAVRRLAELLQSGQLENILGIPASIQTQSDAQQLGIPLTTLEEHPFVDLTIDGADEVDPELNLIKGGGGALTREKILAQASRREVIIVDETKLTKNLGTHWAVPIEVAPFGWRTQLLFLESLSANVEVRKTAADSFFQTDQHNYILDCTFGPIPNPAALATALDARAGIVAHGLFLGLATDVLVASSNGVRHLTRKTEAS
jgi:ribose 5-phosphate isomerase A